MSIKPCEIAEILSLYYKTLTLVDNFTKDNKLLRKENKKNYDDFGYWYRLNDKYDIWIGLLQYKDQKTSLFIWFQEDNKIRIKENAPAYYYKENENNKTSYYIPIKAENNVPPDFLYATTLDEQQEKFNKLMKDNLNRLLKYIK